MDTAKGMDMTGMMDIMLVVMFIGCGLYGIYSYFMQRKETAVLANKMICPSNCEPKKCRQPKAFLQFILPRVLGFGIGLVVFGALFILDHMYGNNSPWLTLVLMVLPILLLVWYVREQHRAVKRFW